MSKFGLIGGDAVVGRYVNALYDVSVEVDRKQEFLSQIKEISSAVRSIENCENVLKRFSILADYGKAFVDTLISKLELSSEVGNFLKVVLSNKRFSLILDICDAYEKFYGIMNDQKVFCVVYAKNFSDKNRSLLTQKLQKLSGGKIEFSLHQDESLIDGLQIRYGSKVLDYSTKSKLDRLKKSMRGETFSN